MTQKCQLGTVKGHFERSHRRLDNEFKRMFNQTYLSDGRLNLKMSLRLATVCWKPVKIIKQTLKTWSFFMGFFFSLSQWTREKEREKQSTGTAPI